MYDRDWLEQAIADEREFDCDVQVGGDVSLTPQQDIDLLQLQRQLQHVRLQSALFKELRAILERSNLGVGTEAALTLGRQIIRERLSQASGQQHSSAGAVLNTRDDDGDPEADQTLGVLLTAQHWQQIAQAATRSIEAHLLHQVGLDISA